MKQRNLYEELTKAQGELRETNRLICRINTQHRRVTYRVNQLKRQVSKEIKEQLNFD